MVQWQILCPPTSVKLSQCVSQAVSWDNVLLCWTNVKILPPVAALNQDLVTYTQVPAYTSGLGPGTKTQLSPGSEARSAPDIGAPDNGALAPRPTTRTATAAHVCYITKPPKLHTAASASMIYLANISPSSTISARYLLWIRFWSLL